MMHNESESHLGSRFSEFLCWLPRVARKGWVQRSPYKACADLTARHFVALEIMRLPAEIRLLRVMTDGFCV